MSMEDRRTIQDLIELQLQAQDRGWSTDNPFARWFIFAVTIVAADLLFITGQWVMGLVVTSITIASLVGMIRIVREKGLFCKELD